MRDAILLVCAIIFIISASYFLGAYIQLQKDVETKPFPDSSCIPCECISPNPNRYIEQPQHEQLKAVTIKSERFK